MSWGLLPFDVVNEQRDDAIAQVAAHAEERAPGFSDLAMAFVLSYLKDYGPSSGEVITLACKQAGIKPHDDRAFGAVYMKLARAGRITKAGTCKRARGHNTSGANIWALSR